MSKKIIDDYLSVKDSGNSQNAPKVKLTEAIIKSLPTKPYDYQIGEKTVPSLFVRVRVSGSKSFYIVRKVDGYPMNAHDRIDIDVNTFARR